VCPVQPGYKIATRRDHGTGATLVVNGNMDRKKEKHRKGESSKEGTNPISTSTPESEKKKEKLSVPGRDWRADSSGPQNEAES